ncbi:MAG: restriction endonuclease subunit S [Planctomycetota bacterium]
MIIENDVLISTVRPNLNAVAKIGKELDGAIASTGFCVLRCDQNRLDARYLFHWVRTPTFIGEIVKQATGASYPAVSDRIIKESQIPLPPLAEQKRIADILDKADAIRRKRQESQRLIQNQRISAFLNYFGTPALNTKGWQTAEIAKVCIKVTDGTHDTPPRQNEGILLLTGKNVRPFKVDLSQAEYVSLDVHHEIYRRCNPEYGDILYTNIGVNVGTAVMNPFEFEFSMKNVALLKPITSGLHRAIWSFWQMTNNFYTVCSCRHLEARLKFLSLASIRKARFQYLT